MKFTKYMVGEKWEKHPRSFKSHQQAREFVKNEKIRLKKSSSQRLYYRIKGKYNVYELWTRCG